MADKGIYPASPLTDKNHLSRLLDDKGIAENSDWRAFFHCLFIQQLRDELTVQQKNSLPQLAEYFSSSTIFHPAICKKLLYG